MSDIAVVGMACRFPHAKDLPSLWKLVSTGHVAFEDIGDDRWTHSAFFEPNDARAQDKTYVRKGAFIDGVDEFAALHFGLAPRRVQVMDPQQRLAIEVTRQALQDAGYEKRPLDRQRTGVFLGASVNEYKDLLTARHRALQLIEGEFGDKLSSTEAEAVRAGFADVAPSRAFSIAGGLLNMIACSVSQTFDLNGPSISIDAACSSALVAIHEAAVNLRAKQCNVALAGGVYLNLTPDNHIGFSRIGAISPSGVCRPFDARADGFVMGEGVGVVVLKRLDDAKRDGDRIYAVLRGSGCNNDGRGEGPMTPRPEGQRDAMRRAHQDVDFPIETIGYVETHGTATTVGDVVEVGALKQFFAEKAGHALGQPFCFLGSIKANIGHTMSAAGVAGFMKTVLALHHGVIPPQPSVEEVNPKLDLTHSPFRIAAKPTRWERPKTSPRRAAVSSFGFGGTNAHVLLEEWAAERPEPAVERDELFVVSAATPALLAAHAQELADQLDTHKLSAAQVAATLATRQSFDTRLAFVAKGGAAVAATLRRCAKALQAGEEPQGVAYGTAPLPPEQRKLAFLFPGQGAQRVGLLKDLVERYPVLRRKLDAYDAASKDEAGCSILGALYPKAPYDEKAAQAHLTQTQVCQPAMAALGVALGEWLVELGLEPAAVLGHSLGEFAAAAVAGMLTGEDAVRLVAQRGASMNQLALDDCGAMLAVMADRSSVEKHLPQLPGVALANDNHPTQVVLSGTTAGIARAEAHLTTQGLKTTRLDVSHAFHSPLMAGIEPKMRQTLAPLAVHAPKVPVVSCITAEPLQQGQAREVWAKHATAPVQFVPALRACVGLGVSQFLQVGAGNALLSFARGVVKQEGAGFHQLATNEGGDGGAQLLQVLGALWVRGAALDVMALVSPAQPCILPPTPVETQRYWVVERSTTRSPHVPLVRSDSVQPAAFAPVMPAAPRASAPRPSNLKPVVSFASGVPMDNLLALFQQQMQLLQSQADILKAQAQALAQAAQGQPQLTQAVQSMQAALGQSHGMATVQTLAPAHGPAGAVAMQTMTMPVPLPAGAPMPLPAPAPLNGNGHGANGNGHAYANGHLHGQPAAKPAKVEAPAKVSVRPQVEAKVMASVARISAFPVATLKAEQTLVGELGFDSLMLVELDGDVGKAFPQLGGLPRELFSRTTTVGQVIEHVVTALEQGAAAPAVDAAAPKAGPVERYAAQVVAAPLLSMTGHELPLGRPLLLTQDAHGLAQALAKRLSARGVATVVGPATAGGDFAGVVDFEGLGQSGDFRDGARRTLALAQRLGADKAQLFVTVSALGGSFGFGSVTEGTVGQVGRLGFTKALAQEWTQALVKAVDVDVTLGAEALAQALEQELFSGDRTVEVGFTAKGRVAVALAPAAAGAAGLVLDKSHVVLVTGGAKGVGHTLAKAVAKSGATVVLAGRSAPSEETAKACGQVKAAGAAACTYLKLDTRDAAAVKAAVAQVKQQHGRCDVAVHAAGVLADALVGGKTAQQLDQVLETKVAGLLGLLAADVGTVVSVGSWSGRYGNAAQTDYSAANEMLARLATVSRPKTRAVTIDFPPWEDSDMVKRIPGFKKAELKAQGVTFLSNDEGAQAFLAELAQGSGEVLVGRAVPTRVLEHQARFSLSAQTHPYLVDHTMAGQRVLPLAAAVDHLAQAALDAAHGAPTPVPFTVKDLKLVRPVLVPETTWLDVTVKQPVHGASAGPLAVALHQGSALAYQASVELGAELTGLPKAAALAPTPQLPLSLQDFYARFTFHGPKLQGIARIDALADHGVVGWVKGCRPQDWEAKATRAAWAVDPLLLDSSFQLAGYWAWVKQQRAGFPLGFEKLVQLKPLGPGPVKCTVTFEAAQDDVFVGTLVWQNEAGEVLAVMTGARAEFKPRDPQFTARGAAEPAAATQPATPAEAPVDAEPAPAPVALDESAWNPAKFPEYEELKERMSMAEAFGLRNPYFSVHEAICGDTTVVNGQQMINFSSYNYVGNSGDPVVTKAAQDAIAKYGTSVSASRVASGEKPLTRELEQALADFFGTEDSIVLVSGHATNVTVIGHVVGAGDLIVHDALAHDSIIQGAKLSGAKRRPFPHNDWEGLDRMLTSLRPHYRRVLICIEGTYSMDGDIPDLPKFIEVKKKHHAMLLVDEAHSAGVVGKTGRGVGEYFDVNRADVDMWMGTLSKSFASCGGYICGSHALVEYLKYTTPGFVYSVGISPPNAAAALAATHQMLKHPERVRKAQDNARLFLELLHARGINTGMSKDTAVVPAIIGNSVLCLQLSDALKSRGINVQPILYPAVEEESARLRFFLSSLHKEEQLIKTANILQEELARLTKEMNG